MTKKSVREDDLNELERLSKEVARLLEERDRWEAEADRLSCGWQDERAAHEATKVELDRQMASLAAAWSESSRLLKRTEAAEARVAELTEKQYKAAALLIEAQQAAHAAEDRVAELGAELVHLRGEHLHPCGASEAKLLAAEARVAELERDRAAELEARGRYFPGLDAQTALDQARGLLVTWLETADEQELNACGYEDTETWLRAHPAPASSPAETGEEHVYRCPACGGPSGSPPPAEKEQGT